MLPNDGPKLSFGDNLILGIAGGLAMATVASLCVLVLSIFRGSFYFEVYEGGAGRIILAYYVAGIGGGMIAGVLRPLARWPIGGAFIGGVAGMFVYFAIGLSMNQAPADAFLMAALAGPLAGGLAGFALTDKPPSNRQSNVVEKEWHDRHSIVVDSATSPRARTVQIIGVSTVVVGAATCSFGAESDVATSTGISLFSLAPS